MPKEREEFDLDREQYLKFLVVQAQATMRLGPKTRFKITWPQGHKGFFVEPYDTKEDE